MAVIPLGDNRYEGLSSDTKPTNVPDQSVFYETNTYTFWRRVGGVWLEQTVRDVSADYAIYLSGSLLKTKNYRTGLVTSTSNLDVGAATNTVITAATATGAKIVYANDLFTTNTPIIIPTSDAAGSEPWHFQGYSSSNIRDKATTIKIGPTFPDQRYVFECIAADTSNENATVKLQGLYIHNRDNAKDGNGTHNILGNTTPRIDAGIIKFEADKTTTNAGGSILHLEDVHGHYMWRGFHILGYVYWPVIWNCSCSDFNDHFVGDFDLKMERGGTTPGTTAHGGFAELKGADIRNFKTAHQSGANSGRGSMNNGMIFYGGYHNVQHCYLNGRKYNDACYSFRKCFTSIFDDLEVIDLVSTQGVGFQGVFVLDTSEPNGQAAHSTYSTYNNIFRKMSGSHASGGIKFVNSPFRNRIEAYAYWGSNLVINDAGAGIENVIELIEGQQQLATANSRIMPSHGLVKIIDKRVNGFNSGVPSLPSIKKTGAYTAASISNALGDGLTAAISHITTPQAVVDDDGRGNTFDTTTTQDTLTGLRSTTAISRRDFNPRMWVKFKLSSIADTRFWISWRSSNAAPAGDTALNSMSGISFGIYAANNTTGAGSTVGWQIAHNNGAGTATTTNTGIAADTNAHTIEIIGDNAGARFICCLDGSAYSYITTAIPASNTTLMPAICIQNSTANSKTITVYGIDLEQDK